MVNANAERKVRMAQVMAKIHQVFESGTPISRSDPSDRILKLLEQMQRVSGLVESIHLEALTISGLVEKVDRFREELTTLKREKIAL